jgi:hypothetical protein
MPIKHLSLQKEWLNKLELLPGRFYSLLLQINFEVNLLIFLGDLPFQRSGKILTTIKHLSLQKERLNKPELLLGRF